MDELVYGLKLIDRKKETSDSATLIFEVGEELVEQFKFTAGQFVTLHLMINGKLVKRSYSLSSAPSEGSFNITIKKIPGGAASGFLVEELEVGKIIPMTPPAGIFTYTSKKVTTDNLILVAAGSGITPMFSILKTALPENKNVHLIYCNRDQNNIIFADELKELTNKYPNFKITHVISQPKGEWNGIIGRADIPVLTELFSATTPTDAHYYMCGPVGLMDAVEGAAKGLGVDRKQIHKEDFNPAIYENAPSEDSDDVLIGDVADKSAAGNQITVVLNDETFDLEIDPDKTILENLIEKDKNPPYSCMDGACMACMAKITSGLVKQDDPGILTDESIADKEILTCKAKLASKTATINFDDLF